MWTTVKSQTAHLKWVHFVVCKFYLKKVNLQNETIRALEASMGDISNRLKMRVFLEDKEDSYI